MTVEMPRVSAKQDTAAIPCSAMACGRPAAKRIIALAPMVLAHEMKHARLLVSIVYLAIQGTACNLALVQAMNAAHTPVHVQMATPFHKQREPLMINANRVTRDTRYTTKLKNALSTFVHAATASQRLGMSRTNVQAEVQMFAFHAMSDMLSPPTTHVSQKSHSVNNRRMVWLHIMTVE